MPKKERPMLGFLFGFNARIGRLQYFLGSVALAIFMTMIIFAITSSAIHGSIGAHGAHGSAREFVASLKWPLIGVGAIFLLISFMLQSMRFRDIGWDPVCVIPAWIAIVVIDALVAARFPALSIGRDHHGTIIGAVVNLGLFLALLFWPGCDFEVPPTFRMPDLKAAPPVRQQDDASARLARITAGQFGRRA
jgi:uncharacterized membrane protein YhaH (DUF805 family)